MNGLTREDKPVARPGFNWWTASLFGTAMIPLLASAVLQYYFIGWYWVNEPVHAAVEAWGALVALTVAALLLVAQDNEPAAKNASITIIASALLSSGLLDATHACLHQGSAFVWTRSLSTFISAFIFALVWLPPGFATSTLAGKALPAISALAAATCCSVILINGNCLPQALSHGQFTPAARFLNGAGGVLYLLSAIRLLIYYTRTGNNVQLVIANLCLLSGVSGLLFPSSSLWDAGWWFWHALRLTAYLILLAYVITVYRQTNLAMSKLSRQLSDTEPGQLS